MFMQGFISNVEGEVSREVEIERHPLQPFLPVNVRILMLGSFPPQQKRWSMDFFYPNFQNDMWRILGWLFKADKNAFVDLAHKCFKKDELTVFLRDVGIAFYDTAVAVRRLQGNASDAFLEIVEPTDIQRILDALPHCRAVAATGQKAADTLCVALGVTMPAIGGFTMCKLGERQFRLYRMPSSSRAYPMKLEKKSEFYRTMFVEMGYGLEKGCSSHE